MAQYKINRTGVYDPFPLNPAQTLHFLQQCYHTTYLDDVCRQYGLPIERPLRQQAEDDLNRRWLDTRGFRPDQMKQERNIHLLIKDYAVRSLLERVERNTPANKPPCALYHIARALSIYNYDEVVAGGEVPFEYFGSILAKFNLTGDKHREFLSKTFLRIPNYFHDAILSAELNEEGLRVIMEGTYENHHKWISRFSKVYDLSLQLNFGYISVGSSLYLYDEFGEVTYVHKPERRTPQSHFGAEAVARFTDELRNTGRIDKLNLLLRLASEPDE